MGLGVARAGDRCYTELITGSVTGSSTKTFCNGKIISRNGEMTNTIAIVAPHHVYYIQAEVISESANVYVEGQKIARGNHAAGLDLLLYGGSYVGHIYEGSTNVFAG
jgi:uncharacterized Zn-binding protein involved in type VI secretion